MISSNRRTRVAAGTSDRNSVSQSAYGVPAGRVRPGGGFPSPVRQQEVDLRRPEVGERPVGPDRVVAQVDGAQQAAVQVREPICGSRSSRRRPRRSFRGRWRNAGAGRAPRRAVDADARRGRRVRRRGPGRRRSARRRWSAPDVMPGPAPGGWVEPPAGRSGPSGQQWLAAVQDQRDPRRPCALAWSPIRARSGRRSHDIVRGWARQD